MCGLRVSPPQRKILGASARVNVLHVESGHKPATMALSFT